MLFGDTPKFREAVEKVREGDICFLYNVETDTLFGPFSARSNGRMNIEPEAWGGRYPAQVRVGCDTIMVFTNASKHFGFLKKVTLELTDEEGKKILSKFEAIRPIVPSDLREQLQRLDEEIHSIAHRIEEVRFSTRIHPADKEVEIDRLKGEFYSKMKDFVWKTRMMDKQTRILDLPSNR
jgi:hypothetical protein